MQIRLFITGRSYHTTAGLPDELPLREGAHLQDALAEINRRLPADQTLSAACLVAIGGNHVGRVGEFDNVALRDGDELVIVAPVAGG